MIIPARNLPRYFHSLAFPLAIKEERGPAIVGQIQDKAQLLDLINSQRIVGIGTFNRIRYLRLNTLTPAYVHQAMQHGSVEGRLFRRPPVAEDDRTYEREAIEGGMIFRHHDVHCRAFGETSLRYPIYGGRELVPFRVRRLG